MLLTDKCRCVFDLVANKFNFCTPYFCLITILQYTYNYNCIISILSLLSKDSYIIRNNLSVEYRVISNALERNGKIMQYVY